MVLGIYNLEPWERDAFAETAFNRLYWQKYKGKFGFFSLNGSVLDIDK